jgi:hypothetical protein
MPPARLVSARLARLSQNATTVSAAMNVHLMISR